MIFQNHLLTVLLTNRLKQYFDIIIVKFSSTRKMPSKRRITFE